MNFDEMWSVASRNAAVLPPLPDPDEPEPTYVLLDFPLEIFQEQAS